MTTFNAFWFGRPLSAFQWACLSSFVRRGHELRPHVYEHMEVPAGVMPVDASKTLPRSELFFIANPFTGNADVGPFSDLFRYKLLLDQGGWYVDVDTICLAEDYPDDIRAWAQENEKVERRVVINGAQMCMPPGDPLAAELYAQCRAVGHTSERREDWGPNLLTRVIVDLGLPPNQFGTTESFYPVDWISAFILMLPQYRNEIARRASNALFLAAYQSFFLYCGVDLARTPPSGSYLRETYETLAPSKIAPGPGLLVDEVLSQVRAFVLRNKSSAIEQLNYSMPGILEELGLEKVD